MKCPHIPQSILIDASQRIAGGESWTSVCRTIGYGRAALRSNFIRAGLPATYPRPVVQCAEKPVWAESTASDWLRKPLMVSA